MWQQDCECRLSLCFISRSPSTWRQQLRKNPPRIFRASGGIYWGRDRLKFLVSPFPRTSLFSLSRQLPTWSRDRSHHWVCGLPVEEMQGLRHLWTFYSLLLLIEKYGDFDQDQKELDQLQLLQFALVDVLKRCEYPNRLYVLVCFKNFRRLIAGLGLIPVIAPPPPTPPTGITGSQSLFLGYAPVTPNLSGVEPEPARDYYENSLIIIQRVAVDVGFHVAASSITALFCA